MELKNCCFFRLSKASINYGLLIIVTLTDFAVVLMLSVGLNEIQIAIIVRAKPSSVCFSCADLLGYKDFNIEMKNNEKLKNKSK